MKIFFLTLVTISVLFSIQIDRLDYHLAQQYVKEMSKELDQFKRTLVEYDLLMEDPKSLETDLRETKRKLLINKRMYNSRVDDLARLAFKSLYGEIKSIRSFELVHTQSCGEKGLVACKEMTIQALRRKAVEDSSASFLESNTIVENNTLTSDRIKNDFKGVIKRFTIKDVELLSGGVGYTIKADVEVEGNLPKEAIAYFKSEKIVWKDEVNYDSFPSLPIITVRIPSYEARDKLTRWLGLKPRVEDGVFIVTRMGVESHYTGWESTNHFIQPIVGVKLGYEFSTWRLYAKVITDLSQTRNTASRYVNKNYFYGSATGGVDLLINNFAVGAGGGIALQDYDINGEDLSYKGIYTFFDASYRFDITQRFIFDMGIEFAQVNWFSGSYSSVANDNSEINTRGIYALYVELGYRF